MQHGPLLRVTADTLAGLGIIYLMVSQPMLVAVLVGGFALAALSLWTWP